MEKVILSAKGEGRREVEVSSIAIPDLWHVAAWHEHEARNLKLTPNQTSEQAKMAAWHERQAVQIKETWGLCHDLLDNIRMDGKL